jgi:hypothetical protein
MDGMYGFLNNEREPGSKQRAKPVEVSHKGADVSGRVLLRVLPLALPDVIYVPPQPLRPIKVPGIVHGVDLPCMDRQPAALNVVKESLWRTDTQTSDTLHGTTNTDISCSALRHISVFTESGFI